MEKAILLRKDIREYLFKFFSGLKTELKFVVRICKETKTIFVFDARVYDFQFYTTDKIFDKYIDAIACSSGLWTQAKFEKYIIQKDILVTRYILDSIVSEYNLFNVSDDFKLQIELYSEKYFFKHAEFPKFGQCKMFLKLIDLIEEIYLLDGLDSSALAARAPSKASFEYEDDKGVSYNCKLVSIKKLE